MVDSSVLPTSDAAGSWSQLSLLRADLYAWFSGVLSRELTSAQVQQYQAGAADSLFAVLTQMGLPAPVERVQNAIRTWLALDVPHAELAADFAQLFLLDARAGALPYASAYTEDEQRLYGQAQVQMQEFLQKSGLMVQPQFKEPADHISVFLAVLEQWQRQSADLSTPTEVAQTVTEQAQFIETALLNWLPAFAARCQAVKGTSSDFYAAVVALLQDFVAADEAYLREVAHEIGALAS